MFSLCTRGELNKYRVSSLITDLTAADVVVHQYPFLDGTIPSMGNLVKIIDEIKVAVHNNRKPLVQ